MGVRGSSARAVLGWSGGLVANGLSFGAKKHGTTTKKHVKQLHISNSL